jgi:hypothetical protein
MFRSSILGSVVLAFATSALACAAPVDQADQAPEAEPATASVSSAMGTELNPVAKLAALLIGQLGGKTIANELFPYTPIDYDRMTRDFTNATKQANIAQTIGEQKGQIDGAMATLRDIETRVGAGYDPKLAYADVDPLWKPINGVLETLSAPETKDAGLPSFVAAAQVKLSMFGLLMKLQPELEVGNRALLLKNARELFDYVVKTKADVERKAINARVAGVGVCTQRQVNAGGDKEVIFTDQGAAGQTWFFPDRRMGAQYRGDEDLPMWTGICQQARFRYLRTVGEDFAVTTRNAGSQMDEVLQLWSDILDEPGVIRIKGATYGSADLAPNVTARVASECQNLASCSFKVDANSLGDPTYGVQKEFRVDYACYKGGVGEGPTRSVMLPAEANGRTADFSCR